MLVELERRRCEVTYVRTPEGYEVDFLARDAAGGMELVQPRASSGRWPAAGKRFPNARKRVLTLTRDGFPAEWPAGTEVQTAGEWLLEEASWNVNGLRAGAETRR